MGTPSLAVNQQRVAGTGALRRDYDGGRCAILGEGFDC